MSQRRFDMKFWAGIGISLFFMLLLFRKLDFTQLLATIQTMNPWYLLLAVLATFANYGFRALRWKYILQPVALAGFGNLLSGVLIGYMANNILPARIGEFIRAYVLAGKERVPVSSVLASLVIDRLWDGLSLMVMLVLVLVLVQVPPDMQGAMAAIRTGGFITLIIYGAVIAFLVMLRFQTMRAIRLLEIILRPFPKSLSERVIPAMAGFIEGVRVSGNPLHFFMTALSSLIIWILCALPIHLVLKSVGTELPLSVSFFILVLLVFAVMVPASPGFIGTYHYACVKGLAVFHVPAETSMGIALVIHGIAFFPVIAAGFICLWTGNISLAAASNGVATDK